MRRPATVSSAAVTIAAESTVRKRSTSGSSTQPCSGSPSAIGTAAPPLPTTTLATVPGDEAAANSAAAVPTSGATRCGRSELAFIHEPDEEIAHRAR